MSPHDEYEAVAGAAQDAIAQSRYDLVRMVEQDPAFAGCRTDMDVYARMLEQGGESGFRRFWQDEIRENYPKFAAVDAWVAKMTACVRAKDDRLLTQLMERLAMSLLLP